MVVDIGTRISVKDLYGKEGWTDGTITEKCGETRGEYSLDTDTGANAQINLGKYVYKIVDEAKPPASRPTSSRPAAAAASDASAPLTPTGSADRNKGRGDDMDEGDERHLTLTPAYASPVLSTAENKRSAEVATTGGADQNCKTPVLHQNDDLAVTLSKKAVDDGEKKPAQRQKQDLMVCICYFLFFCMYDTNSVLCFLYHHSSSLTGNRVSQVPSQLASHFLGSVC